MTERWEDFSLHVTERDHRAIEELAKLRHCTMAEVTQEALRLFLDHHPSGQLARDLAKMNGSPS